MPATCPQRQTRMRPEGASNFHTLIKSLSRQMEKGSNVLSSRQYSDSGECHHLTVSPRGKTYASDNEVLRVLTLNSSKLKPLPARTLVWYLTVGHLTMGRMGPDAGRGAIRRALACRALRLSRQKPSSSYRTPKPVSPLGRDIYGGMPKQGHRERRRPRPPATPNPASPPTCPQS